MPSHDLPALAHRAHEAGLADGTVTATGEVYRPLFGGQRNFGGRGTVPAYAVNTSDGWQHQFDDEAEAEAFRAAHAPRTSRAA